MEESGVLIDLGCGGFIQTNGGLDVSDLGDFKQCHSSSPLG
jgi:hypothetical protein